MTIFIPTPLRPYAAAKTPWRWTQPPSPRRSTSHRAHPDLRKHLFTAEGKLRAFVNLYLNDEDVRYLPAKEATAVTAADTLSIIPSIAGGDLPHRRTRLRRQISCTQLNDLQLQH